ncbi:MAG: ribosomal protein S18-alanine N-acetyltransferase [Anaerolineales bacterium]
MEIVPATLRDLNALRKLERICFEKDAWSFFDLVAVLTFPDVVRLKAVVDQKMVGFVAGDPRPSQGFSWIATVAVHPDHQRKGYGRQLLCACEAQLKPARVRLTVRMSNEGAIALYKEEGYYTYDIWKRYYNDGEDGLVMEKILRPDAL